jgi:hypothetical protein
MRGIGIAVVVSLICWGCRFDLPPATPLHDASEDSSVDAGGSPACMTDPTYTLDPVTGHRYKIPTQISTYDGSIDLCATDGAHLAVVNDLAENQFLVDLAGDNGERWIGLDDLTTEGTMEWVTGAAFTFDRFASGEPNNNNNEDCVAMRPSGVWNDLDCQELRLLLCECDPKYQAPPTPACRKTAPPGWFETSGRRMFTGPATTWAQARDACQALGAHLLVIGDTAENVEIDLQLNTAHWIGYTDAVQEGTFRWVNNAPSMYSNWPGGTVPTNNSSDCVVAQDGGTWGDVDCDELRPYVCECDPLPP